MNKTMILSPSVSKPSSIPDSFLPSSSIANAPVDRVLLEALQTVRSHLGLEVAFISEFFNGRRRFRYVDSASEDLPVVVGASDPLEETYCQRVVDGRLPELMCDTSLVPAALELAVTTTLPVGAHLSIPIRLSDGQVYGTFCCFSRKPDPTLDERDLAMMRLFANFASQQIEVQLKTTHAREEIVERITSVLETEAFHLVYQPIVHLTEDRICGFEMLTRFSATPARSPDVWFNQAAEVGLGEQLEVAVLEKALVDLEQLPEDIYLSLNVSPANILNSAIRRVLQNAPLKRIVLEVTEHVAILDYSQLSVILEPLRNDGLLLAVDDAGSGYASFRHILQLNPDFIKLDIGLIRDINIDCKRQALAAALIRFAEETGSKIIAEGVETMTELSTLRQLGVNRAQGYLLGRPLPLSDALKQ